MSINLKVAVVVSGILVVVINTTPVTEQCVYKCHTPDAAEKYTFAIPLPAISGFNSTPSVFAQI